MNEPVGGKSPVELAKTGSPEAICHLYEQFGEEIYRLAYKITDSSADAMDVVQDVFLALPDVIRRFDGKGSFDRWLSSLTVRTALAKLRKRSRRGEVPLGAYPLSPALTASDPIVETLDLERAIESLSDALRMVFVLKEIEGYTHDEIGELLGISSRSSAVRLFRARKRIRRFLSG